MKTFKELKADGLKISAMSENGAFKVTSYIGKRGRKRVYGYFDHVLNRYEEKKIY